jgi:hypothetical protein
MFVSSFHLLIYITTEVRRTDRVPKERCSPETQARLAFLEIPRNI